MYTLNAIHAIIDRTYERFVARLPGRLQGPARSLPYRLGLDASGHKPWSEIFQNVAVLAFPVLLTEGHRHQLPVSIYTAAVEAHMFAMIDGLGRERLRHGAIDRGPRTIAVLQHVLRARDEGFRRLAAQTPALALDFEEAERATAAALADERAVFRGSAPATLERYLAIARQKQAITLPASLAGVLAAGWGARDTACARAVLEGCTLGLQHRDDAELWVSEHLTGTSWAVTLCEAASGVSLAGAPLELIRRRLDSEAIVVGLLNLSRVAFQRAAEAAEELGARRLAVWSLGQAERSARATRSAAARVPVVNVFQRAS